MTGTTQDWHGPCGDGHRARANTSPGKSGRPDEGRGNFVTSDGRNGTTLPVPPSERRR